MHIRLISPIHGQAVSLLTEAQKAMVKGKTKAGIDNSIDWTDLKRKGSENSYPQPVHLQWEVDVELAQQEEWQLVAVNTVRSFDNGRKIYLRKDERETEIDNLFSDCTYYWSVALYGKNGILDSVQGYFRTRAEAPTWFRVEGLTNVRDIGGWLTKRYKRVRRGMIFRGSEMDTHHTLTENGREVLRNILKIRTDLDLRGEAEGKVTQSPIGEDIRFELLPINAYAEFLEKDRYEENRRVFSFLAQEDVYPVYLHCWGGADRTGILVLLLNALLGVSDKKLIRDYELTCFSVWGERSRRSDNFRAFMKGLDEYGGHEASLQVKAENYVKAAGVTQEEIDRIRSILLA
ncbi:MAG: tyrosine-protein phosphatase [Clostridia bacterium]|nr:tyrosine-protein phosphatase [Clostridia bacterium]